MRHRALPSFAALLTIALAAGCGGGGTLAGQEYRDEEARYRIGAPPSGWERLDVEEQNDLAWSEDDLAAVIQVNASCDPDLDVRLDVLRAHLLFDFTEEEVLSEELVPLDGREALRTHVVAKLDGVLREMVLIVLKKDGCVYDFALVAPRGDAFARARPVFERLVAGFHAGGDR